MCEIFKAMHFSLGRHFEHFLFWKPKVVSLTYRIKYSNKRSLTNRLYFIWMRNRNELKVDPCGRHIVKGSGCEKLVFFLQFVRKLLIRVRNFPRIPNCWSFFNSRQWIIVSNAFLKSMKTLIEISILLRMLFKTSVNFVIAISVHNPLRNSNWFFAA